MFNSGFYDKRTTYILMAILIALNLRNYANNPNAILGLVMSLPAVLIAITFHEFAHAFAADKLGDDTPRRQGRLNLNPLSHLDPIGSVMLVFAGFGWGKPVQINPVNFNRKRSMSASEAIVSIAGPLMNFFLAIVFAVILGIVLVATKNTSNQTVEVIITLIQYCISVNLGLGIFNLIPLPPLDGSKIFKNFLPNKAKVWYENHYQILYLVFLIIWITPIASMIITPLIKGAYTGIMSLVLNVVGNFI